MSTSVGMTSLSERLAGLVDRASSDEERVRRLMDLAAHLDGCNRSHEALEAARRACELATDLSDPGLLGWSVFRRMMAHFNLGRFDEAARDGLTSVAAFERAGDAIGRVRATSCRASALLRMDRHEEGFSELVDACLQIEAIDSVEIQVLNTLQVLSDAFGALSAFDHAITLAERSLALAQEHHPDERLWASYRLVDRLVEAGDALAVSAPERAVALYTRACEVVDALDPTAEAEAEIGQRGLLWMLKGIAEVGRGRAAEGAELLARARSIGGVGVSPLELGRLERGMGRACAALGMVTEARAHLDSAIEYFCSTDAHSELVGTLHSRARLALALGETAAAFADIERAFILRETQQTREIERRTDAVLTRLDVERSRIELRRRETQADELMRIAGEDALTGLANRRTLQARGPAVVEAVGAGPVALALIDVDHFKSINDDHSHLVGDAVLTRIASILRDHVRSADLVARYAGDEFVIVFAGLSGPASVVVCERIRAAVGAENWAALSPGLTVTTSMGVAVGDGSSHLWSLFAGADAALYRAKHDGRDRIHNGEAPARAR